MKQKKPSFGNFKNAKKENLLGHGFIFANILIIGKFLKIPIKA